MQTPIERQTTSSTAAAATSSINKPVLQQGSQGADVVELQNLLAKYGTYTGKIDGIFGSMTKQSVIAFQHRVFLKEDGIVGSVTWQALYTGAPVNMPVLQRGSKGEAVKSVQHVLKITGDYYGVIDGDFGQLTEAAVRTFQKRSGLVEDGIIGSRTWYALSKINH